MGFIIQENECGRNAPGDTASESIGRFSGESIFVPCFPAERIGTNEETQGYALHILEVVKLPALSSLSS